ncbi:MAG: hypothetical protein C4558_08425 [Dehalococcoidia bacterium]|nr:MAG: hypothetical protein C4558_08425 [Dehalococcoidia bacterium]
MKQLDSVLVAALAIMFTVSVACIDSIAPGGGAATSSPTATASPEPKATGVAGSTTGTTVADTATVTPGPSGTATAQPSSSATPLPTMEPSLARLKYVLFDRFGRLWYCDPDFYPVARQDEQTLAEERFPEIEADVGTLEVILGHLGFAPGVQYSAAQQLAIYRDWKMLRALQLDPVSAGYHFNARFTRDESTGLLVEGTVALNGKVTVAAQAATDPPMCPICLARGTLIATPEGLIPVEVLRPGMTVWTKGADGLPERVVVLAVGSTPVPAKHEVVHLVLVDGRELRASPAHRLADGRLIGALGPGDAVDGSTVVSAALESYAGRATFDLLPGGPTGTYWADGVPLASTLVRQ